MERIGVEAFVLKRIMKDLPLHPIPLALKWEHLRDLKLVDPDFRTLASTDLLLGAEVFTSILYDGRQIGPQGTPSTISTCIGWVLFGKIQGNDVIDITNLTLECELLKDIAVLTRSYTSILTAEKKKDVCYPQWTTAYIEVGI